MRCAVYRVTAQRISGHHCGYVGVKADHPLYGKGYSDVIPGVSLKAWSEGRAVGDRGVMSIFSLAGRAGSGSDEVTIEDYFDVHGSLTYAQAGDDYPTEDKGLWFFGFDCAHLDDTLETWPADRVTIETERLADQLAEFAEARLLAGGSMVVPE